jgi:predicted TIM-barrel fold metal-dependent hydrolase
VAPGVDRYCRQGAQRPFVDTHVLTVIDLFGVDRSFFGSNWPVDRRSASYGDVLTAYDDVTSALHADERDALFVGNAERIFHI